MRKDTGINLLGSAGKPAVLITRPRLATVTAFVQRHTLPVFFVLVLVLTWPLQVVDALGSHGLLPFRISILYQLLFVAYMPTVAALIVTGITEGRAGMGALLRRVLIWRVGIQWYALAIFGFAFLCGGAIVMANLLSDAPLVPLLGTDVANSSGMKMMMMVPLLFLVVTLINGEELAWRGFALPRLQEHQSALTSSLLLGLIWAAFHLPLFLTHTGSPLDVLGMISRSIQIVGVSVIFTWLFNHTRGSVLLAYLLHGSVNTWTRVFPINDSPALVGWLLTGLTCLVAVLLVVMFGAKHLRRTGQRIRQTDLNLRG